MRYISIKADWLIFVSPLLKLFGLGGVLLVSGCSLLQPVTSQSMNTYALEAKVEPSVAPKNALTLMVSMPLARPGFDSTGMVYIQKPHELNYFAKNQWVASPPKMLAPLLIEALERQSSFRAVMQSSGSAIADVRLDTEIVRFQQIFLTHPSTFQMTIRAQLVDIHGKKVVATQEFDISENALSDDPYGGVIAANRAATKLLNQIAEFCTIHTAKITQRDPQK